MTKNLIAHIAARIESDTLDRVAKWTEIGGNDDPRIEATYKSNETQEALTDAESIILDEILFG